MHLGSRFVLSVVVFVQAASGAIPGVVDSVQANEGCVQFDAPASVVACDVTPPEMEVELPEERLVQLIFPISTRVGCDSRQAIMQMQFEIRSTGPGIQIVDYGPRTSMYSDIEGPIAVETREETSHSLGLDAGGAITDAIKLSANAGTGKTRGYSEQFHRIPPHKLLLASGTLQRGTAVYFKFNPSPQTTLEGGHQLSITMRVPRKWRGGILRVDCRAEGSESGLLGRRDDFLAGRVSFMIATWLKGDSRARTVVNQYTEIESRLRQVARSWQHRSGHKSGGELSQLFRSTPRPDLPANWTETFMLYDSRSIQSKIRPHLSRDLQSVTDQFLASRGQVLRLAR